MQNRVLSLGRAMACACALAAAVATAAEREQTNVRAIPTAKASTVDRAAAAAGIPLFSDGVPMGTYYPMPREARLKGSVAGAPDPDEACRNDPASVYCNSLSPGFWQPPGGDPATMIGDDVALAAVAGCQLDRYVLKVTGNADGLGVGSYTVDADLYETCPGVSGSTPIPGTHCHQVITHNGVEVINCSASPGVTLTSNLWVGIKFSRLHCGVAVGAPATKGFSADLLNFPGFACRAVLGGFLPESDFASYGRHASFYLEIYTRGDCADPESEPPTEAFPNYKGSMHDGLYYTPGGGRRFADDISLSVPQCYLTAYEVAVKGHGVTTIDLRVALVNGDPVNGGVIPGTRNIIWSDDDYAVTIFHWDFDPPIHLSTPDLWVGYYTSSAVTGPVITDRPADLGRNEDFIAVHDGSEWVVGPLPGGGRYATTDVTIFCADRPPTGSCCDMILTDNHLCVGGSNDGQPCASTHECPDGTCIGDTVCRDDLPEMNCANGNLVALWERNSVCEGVCLGGDNNEGPCETQVDCPGFRCIGGVNDGEPCESSEDCAAPGVCSRAACDGPFIRSCGLSACCTVDDECFNLVEKECFALPPEDPRKRMFQLGRYCGLGGQRCPFGACLGREGDCRVPREFCDGGDTPGAPCENDGNCLGFRCETGLNAGDPCEGDIECPGARCVGGLNDGDPCDSNTDCTDGECGQCEPAECECFAGCGDPFCCTLVCETDTFCCLVCWDRFCVEDAIEVCHDPPANDVCSGRGNDGAKMMTIPGHEIADVYNATVSSSDPGFCCHTDLAGKTGLGTVWYKFVGPLPEHPEDEFSSVWLSTCMTNSGDGRDSLLQVFTMADPDRGVCDDGGVCSVSAQDCADGSVCIVDEETACNTLLPIACSDDSGCPDSARPLNSWVCVPNIVPGQTYYVVVAGKDESNLDTYVLDSRSDCRTDPPMPNDYCQDAEQLEGGYPDPLVVPFDLSGGEEYLPATFDCLNPPDVLPNMDPDVWYNWVAPCDADAIIETCDHDLLPEEQPNTTMIIYEDCDCPAPNARIIAANDLCGWECHLSSCVTLEDEIQAQEGQCYKIRLGGHLGGLPEGDLTITIDCPLCPVPPVEDPLTFLDPEDGTVDARQPYAPDAPGTALGIDSFVVAAPVGADLSRCWTLCETADTGTENAITGVIDNGDGTFTVQLDRPITSNAVTTITYTDGDGVETRGVFTAHPGNVDGNAFAQGADVSVIIAALNGIPAPFGLYSTDMDHSGAATAADLLRLIDVLIGGDPYTRSLDTPIPVCGDCCLP